MNDRKTNDQTDLTTQMAEKIYADLSALHIKSVFGPGWTGQMSRPKIIVITLQHLLRHLRNVWGTTPRTCPLCDMTGFFFSYGAPPRLDALCGHCGSLERQRQMALWLKRNEAEWTGRRVLHFAPDVAIRKLMEPLAADYIGADIVAAPGCRVMSIEQMDLPDGSVDVIVCSHVLEHVDDRRALTEMWRVLAYGGVALIMVPVVHGWPTTYENDDIRSPLERRLHFGQDDHVRFYGDDIDDRITAVGFDLSKETAQEPDVLRHGLTRGETIYVARSR